MERGSINDVPVFIKTTQLSGSERTVIKEAPNVDGATAITLGQAPQRIRVDFMLIQDGEWITDDYETASLVLRAMLLAGGPFTLRAPVLGEVTGLWLDGEYTLTLYDESRQLASEGSLTLIDAEPQLILSESATSAVESAISFLSKAVASDFGRRQTLNGPYDGQLETLQAGIDWLTKTLGKISAAFGAVNNVAGSISALANQLEQLLNAPQNMAMQFMGAVLQLLSLVPSLASQGDKDTGSAAVQDPASDKAADTFVGALSDGVDFNANASALQFDQVQTPSEEDLEEVDEVAAATSLVLSSVTVAVCLAITSTEFATVNSVLAVADALEPAFEALFALENLDRDVYQHARVMRQATRAFLAETAASLPRLLTHTVQTTTDVFSLIPVLYDDLGAVNDDVLQRAVDSVININSLGPEMLRLLPGTTIRYLDPVA
jgi:prophage DNA circulation protein